MTPTPNPAPSAKAAVACAPQPSGGVLFLDIDGVLNGHEFCAPAASCTIRRECVDRLNRVIEATDCWIVISSAWRYMVIGDAMTLRGFEYMLRTHGLACGGRIAAITVSDEDIRDRRDQIEHHLRMMTPGIRWAAVDDMDLGFASQVQTNGDIGMQEADADSLIEILGRVES